MKVILLVLWLAFSPASFLHAEPTLFLVRHAEKAPDATGSGDPELSAEGIARAQSLARLLRDAKITTIFVTQYKRTQQTAEPLATNLKLTPVVVPAKDADALLLKLRELSGNALVIGHGDTIPNLLSALGIKESINIPESEFGNVFVVRLDAKPELIRLHY